MLFHLRISCCWWKKESDWVIISFIHSKHPQNKHRMAGVTPFVSAGWTNRASGLRRRRGRLLVLLCGRAEWSSPPQTQGVVLSDLLRWHHSLTSLTVGGRVALAVARPGELPLATGGRQQWHEGMNTAEGWRNRGREWKWASRVQHKNKK